ncbi:hypothetical protein F5141DRAFT_1016434, partial [Pisolithus sp. B1]
MKDDSSVPPASSSLVNHKPPHGSLEWVLSRVRMSGTMSAAVRTLHRWAHRRRRGEIDTALVSLLQHSDQNTCHVLLRDLRHPPCWIRRLGQNSVLLPVVVQTLDDHRSFQLEALLDSGASGCYIDEGFARAKSLNLTPLPRSLPIYNADGTPNEAGPVRSTVDLHLSISDHSETFTCAVTNTG